MNCLTYLLNLWSDGHRFRIFYNSDHCCGVNEKKLFDLDGQFKKDFLKGVGGVYLPLEGFHSIRTLKKIFNLDEKYSKIIDEYYKEWKQIK